MKDLKRKKQHQKKICPAECKFYVFQGEVFLIKIGHTEKHRKNAQGKDTQTAVKKNFRGK
jgi:hypothetical protein